MSDSDSFPSDMVHYPDVIETKAGLVPHVERDEKYRIIRAYGRIKGGMKIKVGLALYIHSINALNIWK